MTAVSAAAVVAAVLAATGYAGAGLLTAGLLLVQFVLCSGWLLALDNPALPGATLLAVGASLAGDLVLVVDGGPGIGRLAGVLGLALVAALLHQLLRRRRDRVTESLAGTLSAVMLGLAAASLIGLLAERGGRDAVAAALLGVAAALLVGGLVDRRRRGLLLLAGSGRGWPGLLAGLAAGAAVGAAVGAGSEVVGPAAGTSLGLVASAVAVATTLIVELAAGPDRRAGATGRTALVPVGALLPLALAAPAAYLVGRVLLG